MKKAGKFSRSIAMVLKEQKTLSLSGGLEVGEVFSLHHCITCPVAFSNGRCRKNCAMNQRCLLTIDSANISAIVQGLSKGMG